MNLEIDLLQNHFLKLEKLFSFELENSFDNLRVEIKLLDFRSYQNDCLEDFERIGLVEVLFQEVPLEKTNRSGLDLHVVKDLLFELQNHLTVSLHHHLCIVDFVLGNINGVFEHVLSLQNQSLQTAEVLLSESVVDFLGENPVLKMKIKKFLIHL